MKQLIVFLILFSTCNIHSSGQSITFNFLGENSFNQESMNVDRVKIVNNTNGTDTLVYDNIFSILLTSSEITDQQNIRDISIFPNPFDNSVNITFQSAVSERAQINVYSINGTQIAQWNDFIGIGENKFLLKSDVKGMLLLTIYSANLQLNAKLICNRASNRSELKLIDNSYAAISGYENKSTHNFYTTFEYNIGDNLTFTGYSGEIAAETINDTPNGNKTYTFIFDVTDYLPFADFDVSAKNIVEGDPTNFFDLSTNNPTSWEWDFGDGTTSIVQNPSHTYSNAGNYTIKLIAGNNYGSDTVIFENYITVYSLVPVAGFSANKTTINQDGAITFTDQSTNTPTSWEWDFGDGETSTTQNPIHNYTSPGTYTVKLVAGNSYGSDTIVNEDFITVHPSNVPLAGFSANKTTINEADVIIFSDQSTNSPTAWQWDFGDGNTSTLQNPSHSYLLPGTYSVELTVTNSYGSDSQIKQNYITVNSLAPVAGFSANTTTINQGDEVGFSDQSTNSPTSWKWDFGDGSSGAIQNPSHVYSTEGVFTITLITFNSFGSDTIVKENFITVNSSVPVAGFSANTTTINQGDEISFADQSTNSPTAWMWDFGDGNSGTIQNSSHTYTAEGLYTVQLIAINSFGSDTITKENFISVNSSVPAAGFSANKTSIDQGAEISFADQSTNSPTSWMWNFGDGSTSADQNPSHVYTTEGLFTVTLIATNSFGSDTIAKENYISVNSSIPVAGFSANKTTINQGDEISFADQSTNMPTSWEWDFGDGNTSITQNPSHVYSSDGLYTVKLIAINSFGSDTITKENFISVSSSVAVAGFSANKTTINQGDEISFSDQSTNTPTSWDWDFGDGDTSNIQNPSHIFLTAGTFSVQLTVSNAFGSDTIIKENFITVNSSVPVAAFSANTTLIDQGDAINFSDQSSNFPTSWDWDFGDGGTSTTQNPSHTFLSPGTYTVTLITGNNFGSDTIIKENFISVNSLVPVAAFSANKTTINQGVDILFTDQSDNSPTIWEWDFGDGNTSNDQNPSHTYNTEGVFTVELIIANSFGSDTIIKNDFITVLEASIPVAGFSADETIINQGDTINFSDQSTNSPTAWEWDFGDGSTSTLQNPSHTFLTAGTYSIKLSVSNSFGADSITITNYITVTNAIAPVAAFSANNTTIKQGVAITFTDQSTENPTSWEWDFGDGTTSNLQNPEHTYLTAGIFSVKLTVSNSFGSDVIIKQDLITVNSSVPVAVFSANTTIIDQGEAITFSDQSTNSPTTWEWDFGDGNTSNVQNPTHTYLLPGTYTVKLITGNTYGIDALAKDDLITVNSLVPVAAFSANKTTIKQGDAITFSDQSTNSPTAWEWDFGDGSTSNVQNPSHTFLTAGTFSVKLTVSNSFGDDTIIKQNSITVNSSVPVAAFSSNKTIIDQGDAVTFTDQSTNSPTAWEWDFGDGSTSNLQDPSHTFLTAGTFSVKLTVSNSFGADTIIKQNLITVNSLVPVAAFSANKTTIKQGDAITFSDQSTNSPTSWEWDFGDGSTSNIQNPTHSFLTAGTFSVKLTVTNSFGADTIIKQNLITVNSSVPVAAFSANKTTIKQGDAIIFTDQSTNSPTTWEWDFGDGSTSNIQNPSHTFFAAGTFSVKLTVTNSFGADTIIKQNFITISSSVPVAAFSVNKTIIDQGNAISFSDQSTNSPATWEWDFGDGSTSNLQNPSHTFLTAGTFSVKLTVSNSFGADTLLKQGYITVNSLVPEAAFSGNSTIIDQGEAITFLDQSTNSPTVWEWDFGDGSTSNLQNPSHTFLTAGTFSVSLIALNSFGADTLLKQGYITVNSLVPVAAFSANSNIVDQGEVITFSDQSTNSPTTWEWDFGDGNSSTIESPTHSYLTDGTFAVKLMVSNSFGSDTIIKEDFITVNSLVPVAAFSADSVTIFIGDTINFSDLSTNTPTSWNWDFGDGDTSNVQNPSHTYTTEGIYSVQLIAVNSFGDDTIVKPDYIQVSQIPEELLISPLSLDFDSVSTENFIEISNNGGGILVWSLNEEISWLTVDVQSGETTSETDQVTITIDRTGLSPGEYSGTISFTSNGGNQEVSINMSVKLNEEPKPPGWDN